jgi:lysophospholipid acyltransferase (LPLAT)-like uncharacterized protein
VKKWWRDARPSVLGKLGYNFIRFVGRTLRLRTPGYEKIRNLPGGVIICGWHGKSLIPGFFFRNKGVWVIISQSRDGEIQNVIFSSLGYEVIRGSTGRGGVRAAVEGIRALKKGATMAITPDGPRGPSGVVQGGVMLMAQKSGAALVPVGISARPRWIAPTWDHYMFPWPFARAVFLFGDPIYVPEASTEMEIEVLRLELEKQIHAMEKQAALELNWKQLSDDDAAGLGNEHGKLKEVVQRKPNDPR